MMDRPVTTLYMVMSLDGKISTGDTDEMDIDADFPLVPGVREGLHQYYEIEQTTDLWSLNSGRVQEKMGVNRKPLPEKGPVSFVLIDNKHLDAHGVAWFCARADQFVLVTVNPHHPAFGIRADNLHVILQAQLDLPAALRQLKADYGCERLTVQSGGTLNALFLRQELIDYVDVIVAPVLIGGGSTPTLIDGEALHRKEELSALGVLKLLECRTLEDSWLQLRYEVLKKG